MDGGETWKNWSENVLACTSNIPTRSYSVHEATALDPLQDNGMLAALVFAVGIIDLASSTGCYFSPCPHGILRTSRTSTFYSCWHSPYMLHQLVRDGFLGGNLKLECCPYRAATGRDGCHHEAVICSPSSDLLYRRRRHFRSILRARKLRR